MQLYKIYVVFILSFIVDSISVNMEKVLIERYNKVVKKCFDSKGNAKPSYDCSGLITRGIRNGKNGLKYAWSINSARKTFSFAFLRRDQLFNHFPFDYGAGLILYPHLEIPKNKLSVKIRCAFPLDGNTFNRANDGCGQSSGDKTGLSKHCDALGITTIKKWIQTYNDNLSSKQCAFDMTKKTAARDFEIACQANSYIRANSKKYFLNNNELLMNAWNVNQPDKLPIQAFFYITTTNNGYTAAKLYQKEYHDLTRGNIPIVGIFLPNTRKGNIMIINGKKQMCEQNKLSHI